MRLRTKLVALAATAGIALSATAAYAYWSTSGSGTGSASTETRNASAITVHQNVTLDAMYPGDSAQSLKFNLQNNDLHQKLHVAGVSVAVTDVKDSGGNSIFGTCGASNFDVVQPLAADVAREVPANSTSADITSGSIKFHDDPAANQDACQNASVVLTYTAS